MFTGWRLRDTPTDWLEYDRTMAAALSLTNAPPVAAAWSEGAAMPLEQAVAFVLAGETEERAGAIQAPADWRIGWTQLDSSSFTPCCR